MDNKILYGVIAILAIIVIIMGALLVPNITSNATDDANITLIKAESSGSAFYGYGTNQECYNYNLNGVFRNLPDNLQGYDLKSTFYDENGEYLHDSSEDIENVAEHSANDESYGVAHWQAHKLYNVSKIEVVILDPDGNVVFNETYDYDMKKMDLSGLDHEPTTTTDSSANSTSGSSSYSSDDGNVDVDYDIDANDKSAHYSVKGEVDGKTYDYDVNYNYN